MRSRLLVLVSTAAVVVGACSGGSSPSPSSPAGGGESPGASSGASAPASASASAPAATINATGDVTLSGWQSTGAEGKAVEDTVAAAKTALPDLNITYQPIAGDYKTQMATKIASGDVPDVFYVDASYALEWADQGYLEPLDDYISKTGYDTSQFFDGYLSVFKGSDGKLYGLPKDGNTIAMAYSTDLVSTAPTTMDDLMSMAESLKGKSGLKAPMCLNPGLDRGLAFLYAQGGSLLSDDGQSAQIDTDASKAAVQWYMDLFKNGLGMTASDMGDDWCGTALGKGHAAIIFEGGWLDPAMSSTYPDVKYQWAQMPTGSSGQPVTISFTVSYAIGADAKNKDGAWALLSWLTGPEGMKTWTEGGVALPSRKDVPIPKGKEVLANESSFAKPGSGFMPSYDAVQKAFQDAFTAQIQKKTFDAGPVVEATKAAIDKALNS
jgi:multiple sugar transport system substrate-binding protein